MAHSHTRSFVDWLRSLDQQALAALLGARPDALAPPPPGITSLAERLLLPASLRRAVLQAHAFDIALLHVAASQGAEFSPIVAPDLVQSLLPILQREAPEITTQRVATLVEQSQEHLAQLGLCMNFSEGMMIPRGVMSALPSGLEPAIAFEPSQLQSQLDGLDQKQRAIIDTLNHGGGTGTTRDAAIDADPQRPIPQLIAKGLLLRINEHTVRLPAMVRAALRGLTPAAPTLLPPDNWPPVYPQDLAANDAATGAGLEIVRLMRTVIEYLGQHPGVLVKSGALAQRTTQQLCTALEIDQEVLAQLLSVAVAARLIARGEPQPLPASDTGGDYLAPTSQADAWMTQPMAKQWAHLLESWWLQANWALWLIGTPDAKGQAHKIFSADTILRDLPQRRQALLEAAAANGGSTKRIEQALAFAHPILALNISTEEIEAQLRNAMWIGALGPDLAPTAQLVALIQQDSVLPACEAATPDPVEYFIPQGDMTVLVPGPLSPKIEAELKLLAQVESPGLASVYRLNDASIRRALDAGRTAAEIKEFFHRHTLGELPQAVGFLVDDAARKHGSIRGGAALSYIRSDDEALLQEAIRADSSHRLGLRRIAPSVAIAQVPLVQVIEQLRAAGLMPVAEDDQGVALDLRPAPSRIPLAPAPQASSTQPSIEAALKAIEAGDALNRAAEHASTTTPSSAKETLGLLRAAVRANQQVMLGFVDNTGRVQRILVAPVDVSAGKLSAVEAATDKVEHFPLHRITEVGQIQG
ncbi:helicase-associated domain-containing protein [Corynebacterium pseudopelargi]|nr:helicase-associated domain-containing protein [Corynebacterium pseudopelargi]